MNTSAGQNQGDFKREFITSIEREDIANLNK